MATPSGWAQDSGNPNNYDGTFTIPSQSGTGAMGSTNTPLVVKATVDNTTGSIKLSSGDINFYNYNPSTNSWAPPSGAENSYNGVLNRIGSQGVHILTSSAKTGAVNVINETSDPINKEQIQGTDGYKGSVNFVAPDAGDANDGEGSLPALQPISITGPEDASGQRPYANYAYPKDLDGFKSKLDVIEFKQFEYGKRNIGRDLGTIGDVGFKEVTGTVMLAIPAGIQDSNRVNWTDDTLDPIGIEVAKTALEGADDLVAAAKNVATKIEEAFRNTQVQGAVQAALAGKAAGINNLLPRLQGSILNPNTELLFSGPGLRDFAYTIEMAPRSSAEALEIQNIIRFFKEGMAPRRSVTGLFLNAPNVFTIHYLSFIDESGKMHPYINKVKGKCALRNCSVNYTPQNSYMTYKEDGAMTAYRMTLQFTELEPVYYDDYLKGEGLTGIGY